MARSPFTDLPRHERLIRNMSITINRWAEGPSPTVDKIDGLRALALRLIALTEVNTQIAVRPFASKLTHFET